MDVPLFATMQTRRREILNRIAAITPEERNHAKDKDWSPLMLLEHLNIVDALILSKAESRPGRGSRNPMLRFAIGRMRKLKSTPAPSILLPKGGRAYEDLAAESEANHIRLRDLITQATEAETVARHPVFGRLTATQLCDMLDAHYEYHVGRFGGTGR